MIDKVHRMVEAIPDMHTLFKAHRVGLNSPAMDAYTHNRMIRDAYRISPILGNSIRTIVDNTIYVTLYEMYDSIRDAFRMFMDAIGDRPYAIMIGNTFDSTYLMLYMVWDLILATNIIGIHLYTEIAFMPDIEDVAILDDCVYSGGNLSEYLSRIPEIGSPTIHVVIGYCTSHMYGRMDEYSYLDIIPYVHRWIPLFTEISDLNLDQFLDQEYTMTDKPMIYFDHKMASIQSTFSNIYKGLLPIGGNRYQWYESAINPSRAIVETLHYIYLSQ